MEIMALKMFIGILFLFEVSSTTESIVLYGCEGEAVKITCPNKDVNNWQNLTSRNIFASCVNGIYSVNQNVSVSNDCQSFTINKFSKNEAGTYRCYFGKKERGTDDVTLRLKSLRIVEAKQSKIIECYEGEMVTLTCLLNVEESDGILHWKTSDKVLCSNISNSITYRFTAKRSDHKRHFMCMANSSDDCNLPEASIQINLILKPMVFVNPSTVVKQGQSITLICQVESSDHSNIKNVSWRHNRKELRNDTTTLEFENATSDIAGEYTCRIRNKSRMDSDAVTITVTYPPIVKNDYVRFGTNNKDKSLKCNALGVPERYNFSEWEHFSYHKNFIRVLHGDVNGILTLPNNLTKDYLYEDSGIYICYVTNGIADDKGYLWQTGKIRVIVEDKPVLVKPKTRISYGHFNKTSTIRLFVLSSSKIANIKWFDKSKGLLGNKRCTPSIAETDFHRKLVNVSGYNCELLIKQTKETDFQNYTVEISNDFGESTFKILLLSSRGPDAPSNIRLSSGPNYILVEFEPGFDGGSLQQFVIECRRILTENWISYVIHNSDQLIHSYTIKPLEPSTEFELRMYARNKIGNSNVTNSCNIFTLDEDKHSGTQYIFGLTVALVVLVCLLVLWWRLKKAKKGDSHSNGENNPPEPVGALENNMYGSTNNLNESASTSGGRTHVYSSINRSGHMLDSQPVTHNRTGERKRNHVELTDGKQWKTNIATGSSELKYVEVEFGPEPLKRTFLIHGADKRTPYADIDFLAKAEPLIDSDENDEGSNCVENNEEDFVSLEDVQQWNITAD